VPACTRCSQVLRQLERRAGIQHKFVGRVGKHSLDPDDRWGDALQGPLLSLTLAHQLQPGRIHPCTRLNIPASRMTGNFSTSHGCQTLVPDRETVVSAMSRGCQTVVPDRLSYGTCPALSGWYPVGVGCVQWFLSDKIVCVCVWVHGLLTVLLCPGR